MQQRFESQTKFVNNGKNLLQNELRKLLNPGQAIDIDKLSKARHSIAKAYPGVFGCNPDKRELETMKAVNAAYENYKTSIIDGATVLVEPAPRTGGNPLEDFGPGNGANSRGSSQNQVARQPAGGFCDLIENIFESFLDPETSGELRRQMRRGEDVRVEFDSHSESRDRKTTIHVSYERRTRW